MESVAPLSLLVAKIRISTRLAMGAGSRTCGHRRGRHAVLPLEGGGEVRLVLEAHHYVDIGNPTPALLHQPVGHLESLADEPLLGRQAADLLEVALEGGQAAPGVVRQLLLREFVHVVLVHEFQDVYLPRLVEVEKHGAEAPVDVQQGQEPLLHLQPHEVALRLHPGVEEGRQRGEQAGKLRRPGQLDDRRVQPGRMGRHLVGTALGVHVAQELAGKAQVDAAVAFAAAGLLVQGDVMVAGDENTLAPAHVDLLRTIVQHHLAGIDIIQGILARTMDTGGHVVVKETVEHILVVEDEFQRTEVLLFQVFLFHRDIDIRLFRRPGQHEAGMQQVTDEEPAALAGPVLAGMEDAPAGRAERDDAQMPAEVHPLRVQVHVSSPSKGRAASSSRMNRSATRCTRGPYCSMSMPTVQRPRMTAT